MLVAYNLGHLGSLNKKNGEWSLLFVLLVLYLVMKIGVYNLNEKIDHNLIQTMLSKVSVLCTNIAYTFDHFKSHYW